MAEMKVPIKIDGFKCIEDIVQAVLNYTYKGKTLKEWAYRISKPLTNGDRVRSMTDEELAEWKAGGDQCPPTQFFGDYDCISHPSCKDCWLDWLKQEVENNE